MAEEINSTIKIEDVVQIYEANEEGTEFKIKIDTIEPIGWEDYRYLVQSLAKIGQLYQPKPTEGTDGPTEPEPEEPEKKMRA